MVINHGGDSGTIRAITKDPRGKMHEMYIIVLQCKIAPSTYVDTVPSKQHIPNPELNVDLHLESETSVTYA